MRINQTLGTSTELWVNGFLIAGRENVREFQGSPTTTQHKRNPSMAHQAVVDNVFHGYMSNTGRRTHVKLPKKGKAMCS
jgi:hypothetical protein